jgi:hypothetical protein
MMKKTKEEKMKRRRRGSRGQRKGNRKLWNSSLPSRKYFWITSRKKVLCNANKQLWQFVL